MQQSPSVNTFEVKPLSLMFHSRCDKNMVESLTMGGNVNLPIRFLEKINCTNSRTEILVQHTMQFDEDQSLDSEFSAPICDSVVLPIQMGPGSLVVDSAAIAPLSLSTLKLYLDQQFQNGKLCHPYLALYLVIVTSSCFLNLASRGIHDDLKLEYFCFSSDYSCVKLLYLHPSLRQSGDTERASSQLAALLRDLVLHQYNKVSDRVSQRDQLELQLVKRLEIVIARLEECQFEQIFAWQRAIFSLVNSSPTSVYQQVRDNFVKKQILDVLSLVSSSSSSSASSSSSSRNNNNSVVNEDASPLDLRNAVCIQRNVLARQLPQWYSIADKKVWTGIRGASKSANSKQKTKSYKITLGKNMQFEIYVLLYDDDILKDDLLWSLCGGSLKIDEVSDTSALVCNESGLGRIIRDSLDVKTAEQRMFHLESLVSDGFVEIDVKRIPDDQGIQKSEVPALYLSSRPSAKAVQNDKRNKNNNNNSNNNGEKQKQDTSSSTTRPPVSSLPAMSSSSSDPIGNPDVATITIESTTITETTRVGNRISKQSNAARSRKQSKRNNNDVSQVVPNVGDAQSTADSGPPVVLQTKSSSANPRQVGTSKVRTAQGVRQRRTMQSNEQFRSVIDVSNLPFSAYRLREFDEKCLAKDLYDRVPPPFNHLLVPTPRVPGEYCVAGSSSYLESYNTTLLGERNGPSLLQMLFDWCRCCIDDFERNGVGIKTTLFRRFRVQYFYVPQKRGDHVESGDNEAVVTYTRDYEYNNDEDLDEIYKNSSPLQHRTSRPSHVFNIFQNYADFESKISIYGDKMFSLHMYGSFACAGRNNNLQNYIPDAIGELYVPLVLDIDVDAYDVDINDVSSKSGSLFSDNSEHKSTDLWIDYDVGSIKNKPRCPARFCCLGNKLCSKCWILVSTACKLFESMIEFFVYPLHQWRNLPLKNSIRTVYTFSGRRGVHIFVRDDWLSRTHLPGVGFKRTVLDYFSLENTLKSLCGERTTISSDDSTEYNMINNSLFWKTLSESFERMYCDRINNRENCMFENVRVARVFYRLICDFIHRSNSSRPNYVEFCPIDDFENAKRNPSVILGQYFPDLFKKTDPENAHGAQNRETESGMVPQDVVVSEHYYYFGFSSERVSKCRGDMNDPCTKDANEQFTCSHRVCHLCCVGPKAQCRNERLRRYVMCSMMRPRIDEQVSSRTHSVRLPFSVHPKTGFINVPLGLDELDRFDPQTSALRRENVSENCGAASVVWFDIRNEDLSRSADLHKRMEMVRDCDIRNSHFQMCRGFDDS